MIGNGNFDGVMKQKQVTDFTIDCILSKVDQASDKRTSPMTLNKVLNNNPWIPISPLAHFFNPSTVQKKFPLPNFFNYCPTPISSNFIENLIKVTEHNHFYALSPPTSTTPPSPSSLNLITKSNYVYSLEDKHSKTLPSSKSHSVYEKSSCDTQILINDETEQNLFARNSPSSMSEGENKCITCSKTFENNELLEVSDNNCNNQNEICKLIFS